MNKVLEKVKQSMDEASAPPVQKQKTPFDTFMEEKVLVDKPYLDKFQHLKDKKKQ